MRSWAGPSKPIWPTIETTNFGATQGPTLTQIHAETWMALIHGANGITYFCHIFQPTFVEAGCLADSNLSTFLKTQNAQIQSLAAALESPSQAGIGVTSASRVDVMRKQVGGVTDLFAVGMTSAVTSATFTVSGAGTGTVSVLGENRTLPMTGGVFTDNYAGYEAHTYQIGG
jgi:hypothetical protein